MAISHDCVNRNIVAHSLMTERSPQDQDKYVVRFPDGMRDRLKEEAANSGRSLNAEIVNRISFTLENHPETILDLMTQIDGVENEITVMEGDLRSQALEIAELKRQNGKLLEIIETNSEFQNRLMYRVLSYLDEIPRDLAIWAYDMIQLSDPRPAAGRLLQDSDVSEDEARQRMIEERDKFQERAIDAIKEHLGKTS